MEAKYIYGIIETPEKEEFTICGVDSYEKVYTVPYQNISAVVGDSSFVDYTHLTREQAARYLLRHQQVIEEIMNYFTIIPMRLGTYGFSISDVEDILSKGYATFKDVFGKINSRIETDVVATWNDLNSVIKDIGEEENIKEVKENLMSRPEGVSVEDRIKIGSLIRNTLEKRREDITSAIVDVLTKVSVDSRLHDLMNDRMILNAAFLVDKDKRAEFENGLDGLNALYNDKINFRCVGPLPAYSFYTAEIKKIHLEEIAWATGKLGIDKMAAKEEVVKAYRSKANLYHPDKNTDAPDAERQFDEINRAYRILMECLQGNGSSFSEQEYANDVIIVRMRE